MRTIFLLGAAGFSLAFLIGCSTPSPSPSSSPAKHPTSCNKDPKKEPHFHDCNGNIYLPGHMPKECVPEQPPGTVAPIEPDQIVGTYLLYPTGVNWWSTHSAMRIYSDGSVRSNSNQKARYRWEKTEDLYKLFMQFSNPEAPETYHFSLKYQTKEGDPELSTTNISYRGPWNYFEGIKLSSDPNFQFDLFALGLQRGGQRREMWVCKNIGRGEVAGGLSKFKGHPPHTATKLAECEAQCRSAIDWHYSHHGNWTYKDYRGNRTEEEAREWMGERHEQATCPQDRR